MRVKVIKVTYIIGSEGGIEITKEGLAELADGELERITEDQRAEFVKDLQGFLTVGDSMGKRIAENLIAKWQGKETV